MAIVRVLSGTCHEARNASVHVQIRLLPAAAAVPEPFFSSPLMTWRYSIYKFFWMLSYNRGLLLPQPL